MEIVAYTLTGCSSCNILKELFARAAVEYKEIKVKKDITLDEFTSKYQNVNSFPYVIIDDEQIGGLVEVAKIFVQKGLVSSKK